MKNKERRWFILNYGTKEECGQILAELTKKHKTTKREYIPLMDLDYMDQLQARIKSKRKVYAMPEQVRDIIEDNGMRVTRRPM